MAFRDQQLTCQQCGKIFFFTVTEQRQLAAQLGEDAVVLPERCPQCAAISKPAQPVRPVQKPVAVASRREREAHMAGGETLPSSSALQDHSSPNQPVMRGQPDAALDEFVKEFPPEIEGFEIKLIGRVKWYNRDKGYGFVVTANDQEIFFHRASLVDKGVHLRDGDQIEFQVHQTEKGPEAFNVSLLPED